jgi:hypothetical protein
MVTYGDNYSCASVCVQNPILSNQFFKCKSHECYEFSCVGHSQVHEGGSLVAPGTCGCACVMNPAPQDGFSPDLSVCIINSQSSDNVSHQCLFVHDDHCEGASDVTFNFDSNFVVKAKHESPITCNVTEAKHVLPLTCLSQLKVNPCIGSDKAILDYVDSFNLDFNVNSVLQSVFNNHRCLEFVSRCDTCLNYFNYIHSTFGFFPGSSLFSTAGPRGPTISHSIRDYIALSSKFSGVPGVPTSITNHGSALKFPVEVDNYFTEESKFNSLLGPFEDPSFADLHCTPLMTAPKDGTKRRIIVDLSYSSDLAESVNSTVSKFHYLGMPFNLKLPTVDTVCQVLEHLGKSVKILQ